MTSIGLLKRFVLSGFFTGMVASIACGQEPKMQKRESLFGQEPKMQKRESLLQPQAKVQPKSRPLISSLALSGEITPNSPRTTWPIPGDVVYAVISGDGWEQMDAEIKDELSRPGLIDSERRLYSNGKPMSEA